MDPESGPIVSNGYYANLQFQANNGSNILAASGIALTGNAQSVTINITSTATAITDIEFIYQCGGTPTGNIYIDNIRVVYSGACPAGPTPTETPVQTWNFEDNTVEGWQLAGGNYAGVTGGTMAPGYNSSLYCYNLYAPFSSAGFVDPTNTGTGEGAGIAQTFGTPLNLTGGGIRCQMWIEREPSPMGIQAVRFSRRMERIRAMAIIKT